MLRIRIPTGVLATAAILAFAATLAPTAPASAADRVLGGTVDVSLRPDFLTSVAGEEETFVLAASTSAYSLSVIDTTTFEELGPFTYIADAATRARGLAAGPDATAGAIAAVASNDGYVDYFFVDELEAAARGGDEPEPFFFEADLDNEPLAGLAIDTLGQRTFAGVPADDSVAVNGIGSGTITATVLLGHTPVTAHTVNTGFVERIFLGCDDGFLAWVDSGTVSPSAVALEPSGTHRIGVLATADFGGGSIRLLAVDQTDDILYVLDPASPGTPLDSTAIGANVTAVAASGAGTTARIWVAVNDPTGGHRVLALDTLLANAQADVALPAAPLSLAERDGRLYAGLADGSVAVISDLPFVEITSASPSPMPEPDVDVILTFVSSQSGTARVLVEGAELDSVSVTADTPAQVTLPGSELEDRVEEGQNRFRVEVTNAGGLSGHDEIVVVFDQAPGAPRNFEVGFGNERVIGRWDRPAGADDVDYYLVYFGLTATDTSGTPAQTSPAEVEGGEYVVDVTNGTTVWMSVAAVDSGGNMSARTATKSATAQPTLGAADLAGDEGGFMCNATGTTRRAPALAALIAAGLAALLARRRLRATGAPR